MFNVAYQLAENPEHVPLITPADASKHQKPVATVTTINIPNNVTHGNGLIDNSDQQRALHISPVVLSSDTPAHVMRSRLNQYKGTASFKNNIVVSIDGVNGTTVSTCNNSTTSNGKKKKRKAVDI